MESVKLVKLLVQGDAGVGKTCMVAQFADIVAPGDGVPLITHAYNHDVRSLNNITLAEQTVNLDLWYQSSHVEFDRLRPLSYMQTDVFLLVFSVCSRSSFENIRTKWFPEISHHCPNTPYLLVGNKRDLRNDPETLRLMLEKKQAFVSFNEAVALAKKIDAVSYVECSALTREGLEQVFDEAVSSLSCVLRSPPESSDKCVLQ